MTIRFVTVSHLGVIVGAYLAIVDFGRPAMMPGVLSAVVAI